LNFSHQITHYIMKLIGTFFFLSIFLSCYSNSSKVYTDNTKNSLTERNLKGKIKTIKVKSCSFVKKIDKIQKMAALAIEMFDCSVHAFLDGDEETASRVLPEDDKVDRLEKEILTWKGELDQVDDILFVGTKIPES